MVECNSNREIHIYHASAGSGKTTELMNVIEKHVATGIPLHRIAFVTFTRAAAQVAQERVCQRFNVPLKDAPHFRTIHSMCFRAVNMTRDRMMDFEKYQDFGMKSGYQFQITVGRGMPDGEINWKQMNDTQLVAFEQLYRTNRAMGQWLYDTKVDGIDFTRYCTEYNKYKQTFGYADFTDLLEQYIQQDCVEDVDIACIDEAQDCSPLQWQVLFRAFRNASAIYVAGDSKQSIHTWNGADFKILDNLRGRQHIMEYSYRVPKNILQYVQSHIVDDMSDVLHTKPLAKKDGGSVHIISSLSDITRISGDRSYMLLARNKKFLQTYVDWCQQHYLPYTLLGTPCWSDKDKQQFRDGRTGDWDIQKKTLAQGYYNAGTFYRTPNIRIDTIHGVKGDEADEVVLMSDLALLTWKSYQDEPNNEHRVFYVGCTRAKDVLYIMEPQTSKYYPNLF